MAAAQTAPTPLETSLALRAILGRLRRRFMSAGGTDDLTPSQASVLIRVGKGEALTASALAQLEGVKPQSMAATIASLEEQGYVVRTPDATDGRRQLVELTDAGRDRFEGARQAGQEWLTTAFAERFTAAERATIAEALTLLQRVLD